MEQRWEHLFELLGAFLPKLLLAAVIFAAGYGIIRLLLRMLRKGLGRSRHIDPAIHPFILTVSKMVLLVLLALVCLDAIAVPVTPLITALGAVGVAVSLALKDSLANLLGGSLLLVSKPFKIGDYCSINGEEGSIAEVGFVYTALNTTDNRRVFIPNGQVITATVINYNSGGTRCLERASPSTTAPTLRPPVRPSCGWLRPTPLPCASPRRWCVCRPTWTALSS